MKILIAILIIVIFIVFILLFPFKIKIYNKENYLFINIFNFINLKLNLFVLLSNINNFDFEKQKKNFKLIKKARLKELNIKLEGLSLDYQINGAYYGIIHAFFGILNSILYSNDIRFKYDLKYQGDEILEFNSIIRARVLGVVTTFIKL